MSTLPFDKLFLSTKNQGKIDEFRQMLANYEIEILSINDIFISNIDENGETFEENAKLKAEHGIKYVAPGTAVMADDSGLCVDSLGGRPGIYSARYAASEAFPAALNKLLDELDGIFNRKAYFFCALYIVLPSGQAKSFTGKVDGEITYQARGTGFAYDPVFLPNGYNKTFGEMTKEEKNAISHRGIAMNLFFDWLNKFISKKHAKEK